MITCIKLSSSIFLTKQEFSEPKKTNSSLAVTGLYFFDNNVVNSNNVTSNTQNVAINTSNVSNNATGSLIGLKKPYKQFMQV